MGNSMEKNNGFNQNLIQAILSPFSERSSSPNGIFTQPSFFLMKKFFWSVLGKGSQPSLLQKEMAAITSYNTATVQLT